MAMHVLLAEMARAGRCRRMHWNDWYPLYKPIILTWKSCAG
jgi:hypothetical protein